MSKRFFAAAFALGLAAVAWVAAGFAGSSWLAFTITLAIGGVYLLGAFELRQFRAATGALAQTLAAMREPPADLAGWLEQVPPMLRATVRLRIEGERAALPGPALTPYLVGLLVMLGMLGTFLGMVLTFNGAVFALEGSADLQAMRSALAAPIKGLGLSFGTSVAGVAASAMLGLMAAIARRERLEVARQLESRIAGALQPFSLAQQRHETFQAIRQQARVLPQLAERMEAMMERIEQRSRQLDEQLAQRQERLHDEVRSAYGGLADRVGTSLKESLADGARAAGDSIRPVVAAAMAQVAGEAQRVHASLVEGAQRVHAGLTEDAQRLHTGLTEDAQRLHASLAEDAQRLHARLGADTQQVQARMADEAQRVHAQLAADAQRVHAQLAEQAQQLHAQLAEQAQQIHAQLTDGTQQIQAQLAGDAQRVHAQMAGDARHLHERIGEEAVRAAQRDATVLQERTLLLERMGALLQSLQQSSGEQRAAVDAMVAAASSVLEQAGAQWAQVLQAQADRAAETSAHLGAGAVELASAAEAFAQGVQGFQAGNDKLTEALQRIESSLQRSTARSDEQLAYYVAQAREVIDLSIASQQGLVENLRLLQPRSGSTRALADGEPA